MHSLHTLKFIKIKKKLDKKRQNKINVNDYSFDGTEKRNFYILILNFDWFLIVIDKQIVTIRLTKILV